MTSVKHPGQNPGVVIPNVRDEKGNPLGHGSFNGPGPDPDFDIEKWTEDRDASRNANGQHNDPKNR